jgi:hypothetical protein
MADDPIIRGWDIWGKASRGIKQVVSSVGLSQEAKRLVGLQSEVHDLVCAFGLDDPEHREKLSWDIAVRVLSELLPRQNNLGNIPYLIPLATCLEDFIEQERWFDIPMNIEELAEMPRSELWDVEDKLRHTKKILSNFDKVQDTIVAWMKVMVAPLLSKSPTLFSLANDEDAINFATRFVDTVPDIAEVVESVVQFSFAPELEELGLAATLRDRLQYNMIVASGGNPMSANAIDKNLKLPTKASPMPPVQLVESYLGGTPLLELFDAEVSITLPTETRFEHHHIVAGSGHGKTQALQHLILHDLDTVSRGEASIVVIDSQSDFINNIAGLKIFAPGQPLADRLVLIDPTDIEWPVALNLFDVGLDRLDAYSPLDRERLTNSIIELYDFVLGSLLEAGMTQKQNVIFRYITRLLLHIPNATIHTLRELLEDDGYEKYKHHIQKLKGSAKAFFEKEFNGREFTATKRQVLRRLYGILENQTFERMFTHPKSKLDLFTEMNAGKVILINTAKDLLKENGTEIFGRFFIAMITQAAQERAVLDKGNRLSTFVYIDEANEYFDRNIGIILSQARKYNIGIVLAHQYLGQLDTKLHEAIAANTSIKFAGGVSAKDARALANDLRTDASFIESQKKLSFAAFIKGQTERAVSLSITYGLMEAQERMTKQEHQDVLHKMREKYAVHYSELEQSEVVDEGESPTDGDTDTGEPMAW